MNIYFFFRAKYHGFILFCLLILFVEPVFQKLTDPSLFGDSYNVFGFDRLKTNLIMIISFIIISMFNPNRIKLPIKYFWKINRFIVVVCVFHIFNVLFSANIYNSIALTIVGIIGPIIFFYIILSLPRHFFHQNHNLTRTILVSSIGFLTIGLFMYLHSIGKNINLNTNILRTGGLLWLSNISTQVLAFFFPFIFYPLKTKNSFLIRITAIVLFLVLIVVSMSRTALAVYSIMIFTILLKQKNRFQFIFLGVTIIMMALYLTEIWFEINIVELYSNRFFRTGDTMQTIQDDARLKIYLESLEIIEGREMMGTGISTFGDLNKMGWSNAHNIFINILVERGLIGLILFVGFIIFYFKNIVKEYKNLNQNNAESLFIYLIGVGLLGFILIGMTGNDLFLNSGFITGWPMYISLFLLAIVLKKKNI